MSNNSDLVFPPAARKAQAERGSDRHYASQIASGYPDTVTPDLAGFIAQLDTAFLATVSENGAPYIQHRGGPKGFIKVVDEKTLGFADYRGNRQYITIGNLAGNDRAFLFLLDLCQPPAHQGVGPRARVVEDDTALIEAVRRWLPRQARAGDPVHGRCLGRQLLAAHHRALHPRGNRGSQQDARRKNGGSRGRECPIAGAAGGTRFPATGRDGRITGTFRSPAATTMLVAERPT